MIDDAVAAVEEDKDLTPVADEDDDGCGGGRRRQGGCGRGGQ
jgi:hypothetical protein